MKALLGSLVGLLVWVSVGSAQDNSRLFTRPKLPSTEALDRLNMKYAWKNFVPMQGKRDAILQVQIPDTTFLKDTPRGLVEAFQIFVLTAHGLVVAYDRDSGQQQWSVQVGKPFQRTQPLAFSSRVVYVTDGLSMHALDRLTGTTLWQYSLPDTPLAPPIADAQQLFLVLGNGRAHVYQTPDPELAKNPLTTKKSADSAAKVDELSSPGSRISALGADTSFRSFARPLGSGPEPFLVWDNIPDSRIDKPTLLTSALWFMAGADGQTFALSKLDGKRVFKFRIESTVSLPISQQGTTAFVAGDNQTVYALDLLRGEARWGYFASSPISTRPECTDEDVYICSDAEGMVRVDIKSGQRLWKEPTKGVKQFLASNPKLVYALDHSGNLLFLDRRLGTLLTRFDTREFVLPITNDQTDRLILAAHDGTIICLHDKDYPQPMLMKKPSVAEEGGRYNPLIQRLETPERYEQGLPAQSVREYLTAVSKKFRLPFLIDDEAFRQAGIEDISEKIVSQGKTTDLIPIKQVLNTLLAKHGAQVIVRADHIRVIPVPKKKP